MSEDTLIPVIMSGGTGSRLWPMSRESFPKQYLSVIKDNKYSLLQNTIRRVLKLKNISPPIVICNEEHRFIVLEQLKEINVVPDSIILEPYGRNTAPAIAIAALKATEKGENPNLLVLAADHEIKDNRDFLKTIEVSIDYSNKNHLVTFGIVPTRPETGYGYIEVENEINEKNVTGLAIKRFVEKPKKETAEKFIKTNRFLWNSGMFLFKAKIILGEIEKYNKELFEHCKKSFSLYKRDLEFIRIDKGYFHNCLNISIDLAVMEKTKKSIVFPLNVGWSDIGSWKSLWEIEDKDKNENVSLGRVVVKNSNNCYVRSDNRLVVGLGLKNLIIIETNDTILVVDKDFDQEVKGILQDLKKSKFNESKTHKRIYRPWGNYLSIAEGENWQVKKIEVNVGAALSLQLHKRRSEHWIVVKGEALVEIDNKKEILKENQSTYIPLESKHRLSNNGDSSLILIEVQSGKYLGEDDIIRFKDLYGR